MEPAAIRHKNPGAMWPGAIATKWGSTKWVYLSDGTGQGGNGKGNKIATFDNWVDGISAQLDLWRSSKNYKNKRFADAIRTWSGGNNVPSYIKYIKDRIPGITEDTIMDDAFWRGPNGIKFLKVQAGHEAGKPIPAPDADYLAAQKRVFSGVPVPKMVKKVAGAAVVVLAPVVAVASQSPSYWLPVLLGAVVVAIVGAVIWYVSKQTHPSPIPVEIEPALPAPVENSTPVEIPDVKQV